MARHRVVEAVGSGVEGSEEPCSEAAVHHASAEHRSPSSDEGHGPWSSPQSGGELCRSTGDCKAFGGRVGCVGGVRHGSKRSDPDFIGKGTCCSEDHSSVGQDQRMSVLHREAGTPSYKGRGGRGGSNFVQKQMEVEVEEGRARLCRLEEELEVQAVPVSHDVRSHQVAGNGESTPTREAGVVAECQWQQERAPGRSSQRYPHYAKFHSYGVGSMDGRPLSGVAGGIEPGRRRGNSRNEFKNGAGAERMVQMKSHVQTTSWPCDQPQARVVSLLIDGRKGGGTPMWFDETGSSTSLNIVGLAWCAGRRGFDPGPVETRSARRSAVAGDWDDESTHGGRACLDQWRL